MKDMKDMKEKEEIETHISPNEDMSSDKLSVGGKVLIIDPEDRSMRSEAIIVKIFKNTVLAKTRLGEFKIPIREILVIVS